MENKILEKRKEKLKQILNKEQNEYCTLMYFLITNNKLDSVIKQMDDINIIPNTTCLVKKGYLTTEEHFIEVLYHVINCINTDFWTVRKKDTIIEYMLIHPKSSKLLLSKKYIGNNDFIPYYQFNIKKICIYGFCDILKFVYKTDTIVNFFKNHNVDICNFNLKRKKDVENIYNILILICMCNYASFGLYYIFNFNVDSRMKDMCTIQLEMLIEKTEKIQDKARDFLKALRQ